MRKRMKNNRQVSTRPAVGTTQEDDIKTFKEQPLHVVEHFLRLPISKQSAILQ